jgi:alpha-beta hydrolase superfamily lysophospholipase
LDDLGLFLTRVRREYPSLPLIVYGHSMGGNVVLNYALRSGDARIKAVVATGPWIRLAFEPATVKVWSGRLMRYILPTLSLPTGLDIRLLSRDLEVVRRYEEDPLVHDRVSASAGIALMEGARWLDQYRGSIGYPTLLMHGGADGITSAAATAAFASRLSGDVQYKEWPGMYHEVHNEPERGKVLEYIWTWMENWLEA